MADPHGHDSHGPNFAIYMVIFGALSVFTALSFVFNGMARAEWISHMTSAYLIMIVAVVKAVLVGMIFMHLKWDWAKLYFMIVPAFILGAMMMMVLMPDIVMAWHQGP